MPIATTPILPPSEATRRLTTSGVYTAEIPVEHTTSLLVPTLRLGFPAYAFFAAPARRVPGQPLEIGVPDRWGALRADFGRLALYALTDAVPMGGPALARVALSVESRSVTDVLAAQDRLSALLDGAAEAFFAGGALPPGLVEAFAAVVPDALRPAYRALAPDFMAALESR